MVDAGRITHRGTLYPRDLDHMGHVNVVAYMAHFDAATWSFLSDAGFTGIEIEATYDGYGGHTDKVTLAFKVEAFSIEDANEDDDDLDEEEEDEIDEDIEEDEEE